MNLHYRAPRRKPEKETPRGFRAEASRIRQCRLYWLAPLLVTWVDPLVENCLPVLP